MRVQPDWSQKKDLIKAFPDGTYAIRIKDYVVAKDKNGVDYIKWMGEIFNHPDTKYNGSMLFYMTPLAGDFIWKLETFIDACDPTINKLDFDCEALMGKEVEITIETPANAKYYNVKDLRGFVAQGTGSYKDGLGHI